MTYDSAVRVTMDFDSACLCTGLWRCSPAAQTDSFSDVSVVLGEPAAFQNIGQQGEAQPDYLMWAEQGNTPYYLVECKGSQSDRNSSYDQLRRALEQISMIRDIAQLEDRDIQVLEILASVYASAVLHMPNLQNPDPFSRETPRLKTAIAESGIHRDDFLAMCERLRGFGLGAEVLRNASHMGPEDFCYRPTRRGLVLLGYLKNVAKVTRE